jgi:hypothetical protein
LLQIFPLLTELGPIGTARRLPFANSPSFRKYFKTGGVIEWRKTPWIGDTTNRSHKNKQNQKTEPMKTVKKFTFATLATLSAVVATLLFQTSITRADGRLGDDNGHMLHLIPAFNPPVTTHGFAPPLPVGAQLTFGGTLAHPDRPDLQVGTAGVHFVVTLTGLAGDELLGNGCMILPDGKISFQILLRRPVTPDSHGDINRHATITGGTGAYRNAGGELNHVTHANGAQEYIFDFRN